MQHLIQDWMELPGRFQCHFFSFLVPRVPSTSCSCRDVWHSKFYIHQNTEFWALPWSTGPSISPPNPSKHSAQQRKSLSPQLQGEQVSEEEGSAHSHLSSHLQGFQQILPQQSCPCLEVPALGTCRPQELSHHIPITQVNPLRNSKEHKFQAEQLLRW